MHIFLLAAVPELLMGAIALYLLKRSRKCSLLALLLAVPVVGQIPAPQINLSGNIGCQGFPCLNSGTLVMATDANRTMTSQETSATGGIKVTSTVSLTATRNLIAPAGRFSFSIENATTGGQSIQIIGPSGTGVTIANGQTVHVWNDGTNYVQVGSSGSSGVSSFNTRTGAVTLGAADVNAVGAITNSTSGNAATSTAAQTTPTICGAGGFAKGVDANFNATGCASPSGTSVKILYMSVLGCPQNADLNSGTGTDATNCINTACNTATVTNPVQIVQDGASIITGIKCPKENWSIVGLGGGYLKIAITNCTISGGVAILTANNTLAAHDVGTFTSDFTSCTGLNNQRVEVLSSGLSSTQFEVAAGGSVASSPENGTLSRAYGTGFYLASGSRDAIANGNYGTGGTCDIGAQIPPAQSANILLRDFVLNGNIQGQSDYCFGIHLNDVSSVTLDNVVLYNANKYGYDASNTSNVVIHNMKVFSTSPSTGSNTDGIHIDGPASDYMISDSYFKTGDDAIALNAIEGECGPITRVEISNSVTEKALTMMRAYNSSQATCPVNGLVPLISKIDVNNFSGTTGTHPLLLGLCMAGGPQCNNGTLNPAITDFHWSNSTFDSPYSPIPAIGINDNIGDISFSNITLKSPTNPDFITVFTPTTGPAIKIGSINISNMRVVDTPQGSAFSTLFDPSSGATSVGSISVQNFGIRWEGTGYSDACLFCFNTTTATIGHVFGTNIDTTHVAGMAVFPSTVIGDIEISGAKGVMQNSGSFSAMSPTTIIPSSTATFGVRFAGNESFYKRVGAGPATFTLPANYPEGATKCAAQLLNDTGAITLSVPSGTFVNDQNGNESSNGGGIISTGAAGDSICIQAVGYAGSGYHYMVTASHGTWNLY